LNPHKIIYFRTGQPIFKLGGEISEGSDSYIAKHTRTLAQMGNALGKAGINIIGICGEPCEGVGVIHILVEDSELARNAIEEAGFEVRGEREVLVTEIKDDPGELGKIARRIAAAGVNIDLMYLATKTRIVLGVDNIDKAKTAF
jgi:hypothetical protein